MGWGGSLNISYMEGGTCVKMMESKFGGVEKQKAKFLLPKCPL